jgi:hypothetical protein
MNNGTPAVPLPASATAPVARDIAVNVNPALKRIQVIIHENGMPIPGAAIEMSIEEAMQHTAGLVKAIEMAKGGGQRSGLIMPGDLAGGKPFRP